MPSLGFGLERVGLPAIRWPYAAIALVLALSLVAALGTARLKTNHTLSELFRSSTADFTNYKKLSALFPTSEFDILVVVEGPNLMKPELLEEIRGLHLELQFAKAVDGVLSIFSMRDPPGEDGIPRPMFPAEMPTGPAFEKLTERALAHPLVGGKLLSKPDGKSQLTLLIISLKRELIKQEGIFSLIKEIEKISRDVIGPTGLEVQLAGAPIMQLEIRDAIRRDRIIYNGAGFGVGMLICLAFFRRPKLVLITSLCPVVAVLWSLGLLGWLGLRLNTFINVIPPLVMVIAFTDSMHMVFSIRRRLGQGDDRMAAARHAILTVGPACVLTSLTTSAAFLSLMLTDSGLIRTFGLAAAVATIFAFVAVIIVVPTLVVLLFRDEADFLRTETSRHHAMSWLERSCATFGDWLRPRHLPIALSGLAVVVACATLHLRLEPRYRLSDQVPDTKQSVAAAERLDRKLTGAHPVHVMLRWPEGRSVRSADVVDAIARTHRLLEDQSGIGNVWSVETLRRWLEEIGQTGETTLYDYIQKLPEHLTARFLNDPARSALVTGRLPNLDAEDSVPVLRRLDEILSDLRSRYPDFEFTVTGLSAVAALQSSSMIKQLNRGLLFAMVLVILLIGIAFRSPRVLALSIFPNIFPIVAAGALVQLGGGGLEYASVIALTVAFGLAVDDTIHFLNRLQIEGSRTSSLEEAVSQTISRMGPVLVLTTVVLVVSLSVTVLSDLPSMRLFGKLFATTVAAALIGDLLVLPALILTFGRIRNVMGARETK